jgi:hypothetical protein
MKKISLFAIVMALLLSTTPTLLFANEKAPIGVSSENQEIPAEVTLQLNRLEEIKAMDKSNLNRSEKKSLRKEVRAIQSDIQTKKHGIYISIGAFIIIILLLVILL